MRVIALFAALVLLAACAQDVVWQKPGAGEQELAADASGCRARADAQGVAADAQRLTIVYSECMEAKGWRRVQAPKS